MPSTQLLLRPTRDRKAYRLKCRFKIEPSPSPVRDSMGHARWMSRLEREKVRIADWFVRDLRVEGWESLPSHGFKMRGPFPMVVPTTIRVVRPPSAREMRDAVMQGARFLDKGVNYAKSVPKLNASEWWEFEISGVFTREQIMTEIPDAHEEEHN